MTMAFMGRNRPILLKGDPSLTKVECLLKTITKTSEENNQWFLIEFQNVETEENLNWVEEIVEKGEEEELIMIHDQILTQTVRRHFCYSNGPPPKKEVDHYILTMVGQKLINVCSYEYGHLQKE